MCLHTIHESSKFTPFQLMFGRRAILPIDLDTSTTEPERKVERYVKAEEANLAISCTEVKKVEVQDKVQRNIPCVLCLQTH